MRTLLPLAGVLLSLAVPTAASAGDFPLDFDIDGYYRARGVMFVNLFDRDFPRDGGRDVAVYYVESPDEDIPRDFIDTWNQTHASYTTNELVQGYCRSYYATLTAQGNKTCRKAVDGTDRATWIVSRGRFEPILTLGDLKFQATIDVLDNVVWGDNTNVSQTPLFASNLGTTGVDGINSDSIAARRLWIEWKTALGLLRVGRQPSNWGLGLLANDGDGFKNDFGDSYGGSVVDRIMFITRPVALVRGIAAKIRGEEAPNVADDPGVIIGVGFDKLVESSSITFRKAITDDENVRDEDDLSSGGIRQSPIWLSDMGDDVNELVGVLALKREGDPVGAHTMDLTVGGYVVHRWQKESASKVWIPDIYVDWHLAGAFFQGEYYTIQGTTEAIAPQWDKVTHASIHGLVARGGYESDLLTGLVEVGFASGDDAILDDQFTGRALHQDYNVGLILYEQVLAQRTVEKFVGDTDLQGLWSRGGVYNSVYLNPRLKLRPSPNWEFRLGLLLAWADQVDGAIIPFLDDPDSGAVESAGDLTQSKLLGTEVDLGIHSKWADDHIQAAFEVGYMHAGRRLGRLSQYQDPAEASAPLLYNAAQYQEIQGRLNNVFTMQWRVAFIF